MLDLHNDWSVILSENPEEDHGRQESDLSEVTRPTGFSFYASSKIERNTRGVNASSTSSVWYNPPPGESPTLSIMKLEQAKAMVTHIAWRVAEERRIDAEQNPNPRSLHPPQFEIDLLDKAKAAEEMLRLQGQDVLGYANPYVNPITGEITTDEEQELREDVQAVIDDYEARNPEVKPEDEPVSDVGAKKVRRTAKSAENIDDLPF